MRRGGAAAHAVLALRNMQCGQSLNLLPHVAEANFRRHVGVMYVHVRIALEKIVFMAV